MAALDPFAAVDATPLVVEVTERQLVNVIEVALGNSCRTAAQQKALMVMCALLDNVFTNWSTLVSESWFTKPCAGDMCGFPVPLGEPRMCGTCRMAAELAAR